MIATAAHQCPSVASWPEELSLIVVGSRCSAYGALGPWTPENRRRLIQYLMAQKKAIGNFVPEVSGCVMRGKTDAANGDPLRRHMRGKDYFEEGEEKPVFRVQRSAL